MREGHAYGLAFLLWLGVIIVLPLAKTALEIVTTGPNGAKAMAAYLNENVPKGVIIETWEPEMGFFSDHKYHYPPNQLLAIAIQQVNRGGEPVQAHYDYVQKNLPDYLLLGVFAKWVNLYPMNVLANRYTLTKTIQEYDLYKLTK